MKIQVLSDTHLEFHPDGGRAFIDRLDPSGVDVLVAAGDIASCSMLDRVLSELGKKYPHVVYVPGNHEYWGHHVDELDSIARKVDLEVSNVHWFGSGNECEVSGTRFVGATLWFPNTVETSMQKFAWNDFQRIRGFDPWVFEENYRAQWWLSETVYSSDVVVTHYAPTYRSVDESRLGDPKNCFFVCDMQKLIVERQPKLWIHGHTHDSHDYLLGDTRIVCNPYGYEGKVVNEGYDNMKLVEI